MSSGLKGIFLSSLLSIELGLLLMLPYYFSKQIFFSTNETVYFQGIIIEEHAWLLKEEEKAESELQMNDDF